MFGNGVPEGSQMETVTVKPIALKLEVSPEIIPRDTSIGTKIFTLVPCDAKSVRDVKAYLGNFVLKTPVPFHIFMGEYRIREEEDVQILSLINEPCRLVPVPKPRPALSSTPKVKTSNVNGDGSRKRVTFFDGDWSASPVERCEGIGNNGMVTGDVLDHPQSSSSRQGIIQSPRQFVAPVLTPIPITSNGNTAMSPEDGTESGSSEERKKRRRRRHRKRKSKSDSHTHDQSDEEETDGHSDPIDDIHESEVSKSSTSKGKSSLNVLNEDTESEEETVKVRNQSNDQCEFEFDFVTPNAIPKIGKRPIKTEHVDNCIKKKKLSDSAFSSPGSFSSPAESTGKARQDTPVPRVVKNPRFFETARKIINDFGVDDRNDSRERIRDQTAASIGSAENVTDNLQKSVDEKNERYHSLYSVTSLEELKMNDKIAFRVLELDERYNPRVSDFKEGIIVGKAGSELTIECTKNDAVVRSGKYELELEDVETNDGQTVILQFSELLEPKLLETQL